MSSPEQGLVRRSRRKRRRKSERAGISGWRVMLGLSLLLLTVALAGLGWAWSNGLRGPRWLESWPAAGDRFEEWRTLEPGIEYSRAHLNLPRTLRCHALRFDLSAPGLELVVPRAAYDSWGETRAEWPLTWLKEEGLRAVINATPFAPAPIWPGRPTKLQGLAISDGERWSEPTGNFDNLVVSADGVIRFLQAKMPTGDARSGAGGFLIIRRNGENLGERTGRDAATIIGLSADRHWLYWLVVDGGQPGYSEGVSPSEASELVASLGASDAIRMDGGASSVLAVAGEKSGGRVLNRPRNPLYDGAPRPLGNVLGIRRRPKP